MTNNDIIYNALKVKGFTDSQLLELMQAFRGDLPFHTFAEWKARGYYVRKGEKAFMAVPLWKFTEKPNMAARKAAEEAGEEVNPDPHYYKKLSFIFGFNQVEKNRSQKGRAAGCSSPGHKRKQVAYASGYLRKALHGISNHLTQTSLRRGS